MVIFVDTSAFLALLNADDKDHKIASRAWIDWIGESHQFYTSNYVVLESYALIQRRIGMAAVRSLQSDILPLCRVHWVSPELHEISVNNLFTANRRNLSFVDCSSFVVMRQLGVHVAFAFDRHFARAGFTVVPAR